MKAEVANCVISDAQRRAARVAGVTLLLGTAIVMLGQFYVYAGIIVPGNATETARNILAHETRFRVTIVCNLIYVANVIALISALYVILRPVSQGLALAASFARLVFGMMWAMTALNMLGALALLGDSAYLQVFEADRLQALARLEIRGNFDLYYTGLPFFALASTICSYLWLRSRYVPRLLAGFGLAASAWCVGCAFVFLVFPAFNKVVNDWWFDFPMAVFEMILGAWLLIRGLHPPKAGEQVVA